MEQAVHDISTIDIQLLRMDSLERIKAFIPMV